MKRTNLFISFLVVTIGMMFFCACCVDEPLSDKCDGVRISIDTSLLSHIYHDTSIRLGYQDTSCVFYCDAWLSLIASSQMSVLTRTVYYMDNKFKLIQQKRLSPQGDETTINYPYDQDHEFSKRPYSLKDEGFYRLELMDDPQIKIKVQLSENQTGQERRIQFNTLNGPCNIAVTLIQEARP